MRQVVSGVLYDTEKSVQICKKEEFASTDYRHTEETLFRTKKTGKFFLVCEGGPASKYSRDCGNYSTYGRRIEVLGDREAAEFCEQNGSVEDYLTNFPAPDEA